MASAGSKAARAFITLERVEASIASLSASTGVERVAGFDTPVRDGELRQIIQMERLADFLEALDAKLNPPIKSASPKPPKIAKPEVN